MLPPVAQDTLAEHRFSALRNDRPYGSKDRFNPAVPLSSVVGRSPNINTEPVENDADLTTLLQPDAGGRASGRLSMWQLNCGHMGFRPSTSSAKDRREGVSCPGSKLDSELGSTR